MVEIKKICKYQAELLLVGSKYYTMIYKWLGVFPSDLDNDYTYYYYRKTSQYGRILLCVDLTLDNGDTVEVALMRFNTLVITREYAIEVGVEEPQELSVWERIKRWIW